MRLMLHSHFPAGHAYPMQAVAQALVARGHDVVWLTSADNESRVIVTGACFVATRAIAALDAPLMEDNATGLLDRSYARLEDRLLAQVEDYRAVLESFAPDVLVVDVMPHGARVLFELGEIPAYATLGVIPLYTSTASAPLPVSGRCPPTSWLGVIINNFWHVFDQLVVFPLFLRPVLNRQRKSLGLASLPWGEAAECFTYSPLLHLQASCPSLEFDQKPKPDAHRQHLEFVGPLVTSNTSPSVQQQLPPWWNDVVAHDRVVGITQGTLAMDPFSLIIPSIQALCDDTTLLLVVVSPHHEDIRARFPRQSNLLVAPFLPYYLLLPQLCLLITNGGYGSITQALSHSVPLICAGQTEDKKDTAARVSWVGAGIDLKTDTPSLVQVREAAQRILSNDSYERAATEVGLELCDMGGAGKACSLLETLGSHHGVANL